MTHPSRPRSSRGRRRWAIGPWLVTAALLAASCTSATDEFCEQLAAQFRLGELAAAVRAKDTRAIQRELARLRTLETSAPPEVLDDLRRVIDAASGAVRAVTDATEPGTDQGPVDLTTLNDELAKIEPAAQRVAVYADENCGLRLNGTGPSG